MCENLSILALGIGSWIEKLSFIWSLKLKLKLKNGDSFSTLLTRVTCVWSCGRVRASSDNDRVPVGFLEDGWSENATFRRFSKPNMNPIGEDGEGFVDGIGYMPIGSSFKNKKNLKIKIKN